MSSEIKPESRYERQMVAIAVIVFETLIVALGLYAAIFFINKKKKRLVVDAAIYKPCCH